MTTASAALATLNAWFASHGSDVSGSTLEAWNTWSVHDAWGFSPAGGRTNRLYLVRDLAVVSYAPTSETDEEAYARLRTAPDAPGLSEPKPVPADRAVPSGSADGTYYYIEESRPPFEFGPMVYRVTVIDGLPHDTFWDPHDEQWNPSQRLVPYRMGRGENRFFSVSPQEAERWRQTRQHLWDEAQTDTAPLADPAATSTVTP